jgi:hypothetical protein
MERYPFGEDSPERQIKSGGLGERRVNNKVKASPLNYLLTI